MSSLRTALLGCATLGCACGTPEQPSLHAQPTVAAVSASVPAPELQCSPPRTETPFKRLGSIPRNAQVWQLSNALVAFDSSRTGPGAYVIDSRGIGSPPGLADGIDISRLASVSGSSLDDLYVTVKSGESLRSEERAAYWFRGDRWVPDPFHGYYTLTKPLLPSATQPQWVSRIGELRGGAVAVRTDQGELILVRKSNRAVPAPLLPETDCDPRYGDVEIFDGRLTAVVENCRGGPYLVQWPSPDATPNVFALPSSGPVSSMAVTRHGTIAMNADHSSTMLRFRGGKFTEIEVDKRAPPSSEPFPISFRLRQIGDDGVFLPLVDERTRYIAVVVIDEAGSHRIDFPTSRHVAVDGKGAFWLGRSRGGRGGLDQICRVPPGGGQAEEMPPPAEADLEDLYEMADGSVIAEYPDWEGMTFYIVGAAGIPDPTRVQVP